MISLAPRFVGGYFTAVIFFNAAFLPSLVLAQSASEICMKAPAGDYKTLACNNAIVELNKAIRLNPQNAKAFKGRGFARIQTASYGEAAVDLTEAVRLNPDLGTAALYSWRGYAVSRTGEYYKAIADYSEAIRLNPRYAVAYNNRGDTWISIGEYDKAIAGLEVALRLRPQYPDAIVNRGSAWRHKGEYDKAISDFNKAITIDPKHAAAYVHRGEIQLARGNWRSAFSDFNDAIKNNLNACRDNPFASQMRRTMATRSIGRGLARIEPEAGTLIVYSAKHGEIALDGDGKNSPFIASLVERIKQQPSIELRRLFDYVRDDVMTSTSKKQQPFKYGSLPASEDFFF